MTGENVCASSLDLNNLQYGIHAIDVHIFCRSGSKDERFPRKQYRIPELLPFSQINI